LIQTYEQKEKYYSETQRGFERMLFGPGEIIVPRVNCCKIFLDEILNPFYLFQLFSIGFWFANNYTWFAICLAVLSVISVSMSLNDGISSNNRVIRMAKYVCDVELRQKDGSFKIVCSAELLPGDFIKVP